MVCSLSTTTIRATTILVVQWRFDLCNDIKNILYNTLRNTIFAWKEYSTQEKLKYLKTIDIDLVVLKSLVMISYKYQYISQKNYMVWSEYIGEIGKLIGGWIKSCQKG